MAHVISTLRHRTLESGGIPSRLSGHMFSLKWGAVMLLVLLAAITAVVVSALRHDATAKQAITSNTSSSHGTETPLTPVSTPKTSAAKTEVQSSSQSVTTHVTSGGSKGSTNVTVNGQNVPVPASGNVHKVVTDDNGNTAEVNISTNSDQSGSSSDSSMNVNISSEQSTSIDNSE